MDHFLLQRQSVTNSLHLDFNATESQITTKFCCVS